MMFYDVDVQTRPYCDETRNQGSPQNFGTPSCNKIQETEKLQETDVQPARRDTSLPPTKKRSGPRTLYYSMSTSPLLHVHEPPLLLHVHES